MDDRPSSPVGRDADLARARSLIDVRRWADAEAVLVGVVARSPDDAEPLCLLAHCCLGRDDVDTALDWAQRACAVAPDDEWAHRLRSTALRLAGRTKESLRAADEVVALDPTSPVAHVNRSLALLARRRSRAAVAAADEAIGFAPEFAAAHEARGLALLELGRLASAAQEFEWQLGRDPSSVTALGNLGAVRMRQRRLDEAADLFARAAQLDPTTPAHRIGAGQAGRAARRRPMRTACLLALGALVGSFWLGWQLALIVVLPLSVLAAVDYVDWRRTQTKGGGTLPPGVAEAAKDLELTADLRSLRDRATGRLRRR